MNKQEVETLVDKIVTNYFNDELPVFELDREKLFENAWNENYEVQETNDFEGINKAAFPIEMVLGCISTVVGTIKTIFDINELMQKKEKETGHQSLQVELVADKWLAQLQLAGLDKDKAQLIANTFSNDLEKILKNDK